MSLFDNIPQARLAVKLPNHKDYNYIYDQALKRFLINVPDGELIYCENYFSKEVSDRLMSYFIENESGFDGNNTDWRTHEKDKLASVLFKNIHWQHDQIKMFGKNSYQPRYTAWYGDSNTAYTYSNLTMQPQPWNDKLNFIKEKIKDSTGTAFNSVLMNWYRDGNDHMGWHADDEKELGRNPVIASINLGATRRFLLRRKDDKTQKIEFALKHGTLLVMQGALQHYWQHSIPKQMKIKENRINLTFRVVQH